MTPDNVGTPANPLARTATPVVAKSPAIASTTQPTLDPTASPIGTPVNVNSGVGVDTGSSGAAPTQTPTTTSSDPYGMVDTNGQYGFGPSNPVQINSATAAMLGLTPQGDGTYLNSQGQVAGYQQGATATPTSGNPIASPTSVQQPTSPVNSTSAPQPYYPNYTTGAPGSTVSGNQPGTSVAIPNPASGLPGLNQGGIQNSVSTSNVPGLVGGDALSQAMQQAQQAAYQQATAYLDPQFADQQNALQTQLVNQGIPQNSEAWNKAMDDFQRQKTFAYQQAQAAAVGQGNAAQAQLFGEGLSANQNQYGQNLTSGQFTNAAQQQAASQILQQMGYNTQLGTAGIGAQTSANQLSELMSQNNFNNSMSTRQEDINELLLQQQNPLQMYNALINGTSVNSPNFTQTPGTNVGGTDIASIIQQALNQQNNVYNTQVGASNSNTAAEASIIAALLSDRRFKRNVRQIGMHEIGVPLYAFEYVWGEPGIGVMADELESVLPRAIIDLGGIKAVNYAEFSKVS